MKRFFYSVKCFLLCVRNFICICILEKKRLLSFLSKWFRNYLAFLIGVITKLSFQQLTTDETSFSTYRIQRENHVTGELKLPCIYISIFYCASSSWRILMFHSSSRCFSFTGFLGESFLVSFLWVQSLSNWESCKKTH